MPYDPFRRWEGSWLLRAVSGTPLPSGTFGYWTAGRRRIDSLASEIEAV